MGVPKQVVWTVIGGLVTLALWHYWLAPSVGKTEPNEG